MNRFLAFLSLIVLFAFYSEGKESQVLQSIKDCLQNSEGNCMKLVDAMWSNNAGLPDTVHLMEIDKLCLYLAKSGDVDFALNQSLKYLELANELKSVKFQVLAAQRLANLYKNKSSWSKCEKYNKKSIDLSKGFDLRLYSTSLTNYANYHRIRGNYEEAQELALKALKIAEGEAYNMGLFKAYLALSNIYNMNRIFDKAYQYQLKAGDISLSLDDDSLGYIVSYSSAATILMGMQQFDSAQGILLKVLPLLKRRGIASNLAMISTHIGTTYIRAGNYEKAKFYYDEGLKYANEAKNQVVILYVHRMLASYYLELNDEEKALEEAYTALSISEKIGVNQNTLQIIETLAEIHGELGNEAKSLSYRVDYYELKDSLIGSSTNMKLAEMEKSYEDEIKAKEIESLKNEARIKGWRNTLGFIGLGLLAVLAWLLVNRQRIKINANEKIALQKEELHKEQIALEKVEKEKLALELDQNKRELTGKALHIAEKNELLGQLETQLKNIDSNDVKAVEKILRNIKISSVQENDWNQFVSVFESVHPNFIAKIKSDFVNLTASDIRLSTLIKMNFNTKQIAAILHISELGVKKARYRLRKKLQLNEDDSLEEFIASVK